MFSWGKDRLAATLLAGAETAADLAAGLLSTAELHVGLGLHRGRLADDTGGARGTHLHGRLLLEVGARHLG